MILLLATMVNMAYAPRSGPPRRAAAPAALLLSAIIGVDLLVLKGWCDALLALIDLSAALVTLALLLKRLNKPVI